jgi:hypothetical protein
MVERYVDGLDHQHSKIPHCRFLPPTMSQERSSIPWPKGCLTSSCHLRTTRMKRRSADQIQRMIRKHEDTTSRRILTPLSLLELKKGKRISISFYPGDIVSSSSEDKLKKKLGSTNEKSGIYEIQCDTRNCGYKNIGQTRRSIKTLFKEH